MAPVIGSYLSPNFCFFSHWKAIPFQKKKLIYNFRAKGNKAQRGEWVLACYGEGIILPLPLPSLASPGTHTCLPSPTLFLKPLRSPESQLTGTQHLSMSETQLGTEEGQDQEQEVAGNRVGLQSEQLDSSWDDCAVDSSLGVSQWSSCGLRAGSGP